MQDNSFFMNLESGPKSRQGLLENTSGLGRKL